MLSLNVDIRSKEKKELKKIRKEDFLPGIIYGKSSAKNLPVKISYPSFENIYKEAGKGTIVNLKIKEEKENKEYSVLIREVQKHPISDKFIHVDFYQLPMEKEVEVTIPLEFEGTAPAEKELGGILIKNIHEIKIKTLPKNLISSVKVDVSSLKNFEDEIRIKDLKISSEIKIQDQMEGIVASVGKQKEEIVEEVAAEEKPEEIEVVKEKKKEEKEEKEGKEEQESKK